ncbi:MAG: hypothetical protein GY772_29220, partial [bacterium]|nr:hypothetical protein [bacterium]
MERLAKRREREDAATVAQEEAKQWNFPRAARAGQHPRDVRKAVKALPEKMKDEMLRGKECREEFDKCWTTAKNQPKHIAEYHFHAWLDDRGMGDLWHCPLQDLWKMTRADLPKNLAAFPRGLPPKPPPADDWECYDLNFPPPGT